MEAARRFAVKLTETAVEASKNYGPFKSYKLGIRWSKFKVYQITRHRPKIQLWKLEPPSIWGHQFIRSLRHGRTRDFATNSKSKSYKDSLTDSLPEIPSRFTMADRIHLILKPLGFTLTLGTSIVVGCAIWTYEDYRNGIIERRRNSFSFEKLRDMFSTPEVSDTGPRFSPGRLEIAEWWNGLSSAEKLFWPILAVNGLVWLAWKVPALGPTMLHYFSATPVSRALCWPLLLSSFSHYSFIHLAANMFVLSSFLPVAVDILGKENFVCLYLTGGLVASLGSHYHKLLIGSNVPSLGASGAIMAILGLVCSRRPDTQLGVIFIPNIQFSADTALKCILAVDTMGLLMGWKFMDHAAHLSGCLFGIAFSQWGGKYLRDFREFVINKWHTLRPTIVGGS